jgi:hypothetical protein
MGEICKARDTRLERDVAIEVLPPGLAAVHEMGSVCRAGLSLRITAQLIWNVERCSGQDRAFLGRRS